MSELRSYKNAKIACYEAGQKGKDWLNTLIPLINEANGLIFDIGALEKRRSDVESAQLWLGMVEDATRGAVGAILAPAGTVFALGRVASKAIERAEKLTGGIIGVASSLVLPRFVDKWAEQELKSINSDIAAKKYRLGVLEGMYRERLQSGMYRYEEWQRAYDSFVAAQRNWKTADAAFWLCHNRWEASGGNVSNVRSTVESYRTALLGIPTGPCQKPDPIPEFPSS
jgi:hypothetical protein